MKIIPWERTEAYREMADFSNRMYKNGYVSKDTLAISSQKNPHTMAAAGETASYIHIWETSFDMNAQVKATHPDWEFKSYNFFDTVSSNAMAVNQCICLNVNGKNPERVLMFLNWIYESQDNYNLLLYGIEGKTYNLVGDQYESVKNNGVDVYCEWFGQWAFHDFDFHRYSTDKPKDFKQQYYDVATYKSIDLPHAGFNFNTDPIKTEYAQRISICNEMGKAIEQGVLGSDKIDEYIRRQDNAGTDKIIEEIQKQISEWKASTQGK